MNNNIINNKGFTLVELVAVIVLIGLISMLSFPTLNKLTSNNNELEFKTYEDMMIESAKTNTFNDWKEFDDNYYICLNNLKIDKISNNIYCKGYVLKYNDVLTPYLYCKNNNGNKLYETNNYVDKGCEFY